MSLADCHIHSNSDRGGRHSSGYVLLLGAHLTITATAHVKCGFVVATGVRNTI